MASTRAVAPNITGRELQALLDEITGMAVKIEQHCFATDENDIDSLQAAFYAMRERVAYMGWIADWIAQRAGLNEFKGDANEWLLSPAVLESGVIEQTSASEGVAA